MRKRSTTIDAENEEEYIEIMKSQELVLNQDRKKRLKEVNLNCYQGDELGFASDRIYNMSIKESSLEEQEKEEEEELSNNLHILNLSYKERDTNEFLNSLSHLSKDSNLGLLPKNFKAANSFRPFTLNSIDNFSFEKLSNVSTNDFEDEQIMHSILLQNLEIYEDVIKVMVLGDKCSGKSLLISKLLNKGKQSYIPTKSLEIYNRIINLFGKFVKLELFDTCSNILCDSLMKIYYKLSNGFIIICNNEDINSIKFVESQLDYITKNYSLEKKKIMILCNQRAKLSPLLQNNNQNMYISTLKKISEKFNIKVHYININEVIIDDLIFNKFFNSVLISKNSENPVKKKKISKKRINRVNSSTELTDCLSKNPYKKRNETL